MAPDRSGASAGQRRERGGVQRSAGPGGQRAPSPNRSVSGGRGRCGVDLECDMLVLGAGPGGYSAAFRAADLGMKTVLVERYATLGGVCLNVGCIPSKALLHVAAVMDEVSHFESLGVSFGKPTVDLAKLRAHKDKVVGKLTGGLSAMAKMRKVTVVRGVGQFVDPHTSKWRRPRATVTRPTARSRRITFQATASSRRGRRPCTCPSCRRTRAWSTRPARSNSRACPSAC